MKRTYILLVGLAIILLAGCEPQPNTGKGFSLPEGDASKGKLTFIKLGCNTCHSIADIDQLPRDDQSLPHVKLGGSVSTIKTYGELVTSVINPSHKILRRKPYNQGTVMDKDGSSIMRIYNDVMTVTQLVNLVTFLEGNYEVIPYRRTVYSRVDSIN
jgi:sulfur-oxidizing protein SoxX